MPDSLTIQQTETTDKVILVCLNGNVGTDKLTFEFSTHLFHHEGLTVARHTRNKQWVENAGARGNKVIIAAAGMAAALPGVCAAYTSLPVIGVPMSSELNGMDSLLSISQMPKGVPVACMSIGKAGAINAAYLSKRILDLVEDSHEKPYPS